MKTLIYLCMLSFSLFSEDQIAITYQLMDAKAFQERVVGNTVVGITRQSFSLYMLYFERDGTCILLKGNKEYQGEWWFEKEYVRAFWPEYQSAHPQSIFSKENPRYGNATAIQYYFDGENILVANKNFTASVLLLKGKAF